MDVAQPPLPQSFQNRIHHPSLSDQSRKSLTLQYTYPLTLHLLPSPLTPLSAILVLLLIHISPSLITAPTSPASALCTFVTSAASDPCSTLKLPPPLLPPLSTQSSITGIPSSSIYSTQLKRLQFIQNSLVRTVTRTPKHHHVTPILKSL